MQSTAMTFGELLPYMLLKGAEAPAAHIEDFINRVDGMCFQLTKLGIDPYNLPDKGRYHWEPDETNPNLQR